MTSYLVKINIQTNAKKILTKPPALPYHKGFDYTAGDIRHNVWEEVKLNSSIILSYAFLYLLEETELLTIVLFLHFKLKPANGIAFVTLRDVPFRYVTLCKFLKFCAHAKLARSSRAKTTWLARDIGIGRETSLFVLQNKYVQNAAILLSPWQLLLFLFLIVCATLCTKPLNSVYIIYFFSLFQCFFEIQQFLFRLRVILLMQVLFLRGNPVLLWQMYHSRMLSQGHAKLWRLLSKYFWNVIMIILWRRKLEETMFCSKYSN